MKKVFDFFNHIYQKNLKLFQHKNNLELLGMSLSLLLGVWWPLAGLVLYLMAFGFRRTGRFFTARTYRVVTTAALCFYCLAKSYVFFTGANGLESGIPLGTPGSIFSAGLILPLNLCVGAVVACTIYAFYVMFRKGGF